MGLPRRTLGRISIRSVHLALVTVFTPLMAGCGQESVENPADLVLTNGVVVTVDENTADGEAIAVTGGRIVAVGSSEEIAAFVGPNTEVHDLDGSLAIPGLIEGHGHFMGVGYAQLQLALAETNTWQEIVDLVAAAVAESEPGELIIGRGWHQEKWDVEPDEHVDGVPLHRTLSEVSPNNPVLLTHASGHATYANGLAMEVSGVDASTPDPRGGEIVRDRNGNPTGMFRETASGLLRPAREGAPSAAPRRVAELAAEEILSKGITSFHDAGVGFPTIDLYRELADEGALGVRLWVMVSTSNEQMAENLATYRTEGYGNDYLTVAAIKGRMDGALGSHGAWLLDPYADMPASRGLNTVPVEVTAETARLAALHDYQFAVHAIGDRANREILDIFQATFEAEPDRTDWRWRVEHAQHLSSEDIPRFAELDVIAAMQGIHATSDAPYVYERLGADRAEEGAYVWQKLMQSGAMVVNGTDAPVEDVDPLASYYASVSRRTRDGSVFFEDQRMSRMEALRTYTINVAFASKQDELKGSLTPGKLADITVLSQNILTVAEDQLPQTEVLMTIVGGVVRYVRD